MSINVIGLKFDDYEYRLDALVEINRLEIEIDKNKESITNSENYLKRNNQSSQEVNETRGEIEGFQSSILILMDKQKKLKKYLGKETDIDVKGLNIRLDAIEYNRANFRKFRENIFPKPPFNWNKQR